MEACTERTQPNIIRTSSVRLITVIVDPYNNHSGSEHSSITCDGSKQQSEQG